MIQYPITLRELARRVGVQRLSSRNQNGTLRRNAKEVWLAKAYHLSTQMRANGAYNVGDRDEIWKVLKPIFVKIQSRKCAYCEKSLLYHKSGASTGDIEHYRPKKGVEIWPTKHPIPVGVSDPDCYYLLAFNLRNYLLACEICNRDFKRNYFPIAGPRCPTNSKRPRNLYAERPYLLHPLDLNDTDPEELIEFRGIVPVPKAVQGTHDYWRAIVTIELLGLTGGNRLDLDIERSKVIERLHLALNCADSNDPKTRKIARKALADLQDKSLPHRNCARSFERMYASNPVEAARYASEAKKFVQAEQQRIN